MKNFTLFLTFILLSSNYSFAQNNVYYSRDARLQITGEYQKKLLMAKTDALRVVLDYETAEIILRFPMNSLTTNFDTLNELLKFNPNEVVFKGKLGLDYINTQIQHPQTFNVEGLLIINKSRTMVNGEGELYHVDDVGEVSCMLGLVWPLDLKELDIDLGFVDLESEFEVAITQAVLHVDKN